MLRSRMFTPGFRLFFGLCGFLLVSALVLGVSTQLQQPDTSLGDAVSEVGIINAVLGPLTIGWKGAVGNHVGYSVLLAGAAASFFLAVVLVAYRDADPEAQAQLVGTESVPLTRAPQGNSFLPIVGAFGAGVVAFGWVYSSYALYGGLAVLVLVAGTWALRAWAERATGDPEVNHLIYRRFIDPVRVPVLAALGVGFVVFGFSRVLLAAPDKNLSAAFFGIVGLLFFIATVLVALGGSKLHRNAIVALVFVGALAILGGMIWGLAAGERDIEHHGGEGSEMVDGGHEGGLAPLLPNGGGAQQRQALDL